MGLDAGTALVAASGLHAGFSVVVTAVVYPALADTADTSDTDNMSDTGWARRHDAHSRRIARVVAPLYLLVAAACAWRLATGPEGWEWVALGGNAVAALVTATLAAPTHARLGRLGPRPDLLSRLLRVDRARTAAAVLAALAALLT